MTTGTAFFTAPQHRRRLLRCCAALLAAVTVSVAAPALLGGCSADDTPPPNTAATFSDTRMPPAAPDIPIGTDISTLGQKQPPIQHTGTVLAGNFEISDDRSDDSGAEPPLLQDIITETEAERQIPRRRSDAEMAASSEKNPVEITWDQLIPADYSSEEALAKFQDQIAILEDSDPRAEALYKEIIATINNAPADPAIDRKWIRLPGFIAPLSQTGDRITEFLLVPYFGACIHAPPPPVNQTVLIQAAKDNGIPLDDAYFPVWISGKIEIESHPTEIGAAGYVVRNATVEPYDEL